MEPRSYASRRRFKRWSDKGIWFRLFSEFKSQLDLDIVTIDSTVVRAHSCSSGFKDCVGRSVGGFSTKIHTIIDCNGKPIKFILSEGQRQDITEAFNLTKEQANNIVIADRGYDCDRFIDHLKDKRCKIVIPSKKNRKLPREFEHNIYKLRNVIKRFFSKIKHFRRIFSRFH